MATPVRTPPSAWIEAGLHALAQGGPDAVRIDVLAKRLGVTRGGFYWHFDNRRALLDAMLDSWERAVIDDVIEQIEEEGGDARARLRRLFSLAGSLGELARVELAVRDWARRDAAVAERLKRIDNRRMDYMRKLFSALSADEDDVEVRCMLILSAFVASNFIAADHGARSRRDVLELAVERVVELGATKRPPRRTPRR